MENKKNSRKPTWLESAVVLVLSIMALLIGIVVFKVDPHIPLFIATIISALFAFYLRYEWEEIENAIMNGIKMALVPMVIILLIGMTVGGWIACGTVPYIIYLGLKLISPTWFLLTSVLLCSMMSLATGSSWTTLGTIGVALMGVGYGIGIPPEMTAGAVASGAFFGDKQSPLSDTTNFAPAVAGTTLYEHVRSMLYSTVPALIITCIAFTVLGFKFSNADMDAQQVNLIISTFENNFNLSPLMLIPPIALVILIVKKVPAVVGMSIAAVMGLVFAVLFQGSSFGDAFNYLHYGYVGQTGVEVVDKLLTRGGLHSMLWTISLMFISLAMAGILEKIGALEVVLNRVRSIVKSVFGLITTTLLSVLGLNYFAADIYLAMLLPARTFAPCYDEKNIHRKVLSRSIEDTGTLAAPMVPWGTGGVFTASTLGVATMSYLPYYIIGWVTPLVSMVLAATGWGIFYTYKEQKAAKQ